MAKYCPVLECNVVYLTCLECEDKECINPTGNENKPENEKNIASDTKEGSFL